MNDKTLHTLEYFKVLERLAGYAAFSASAELARALRPTSDASQIAERLTRTSEARRLLSIDPGITIGGARDIRPQIELAAHGGVLSAAELLEVKNTLLAARNMLRPFNSPDYPHLSAIAAGLTPPPGLIEAICRCISDNGEVLDRASPHLAAIRSDMKTSHEKILQRLERLINDPKNTPMLQEPIITLRNGRYVIPLRADFKGKLRSIIHDQSATGLTLFVEPLAVVELNNRWHELQLEERDEVRRILAELSGLAGSHAGQINSLVAALADLDLALACARYGDDLHAAEPQMLPFNEGSPDHPGSTIRLYQARHPLLEMQKAVPVDIDLDNRTFALVITGPNTGGKTVTLKTAGLLALMGQSGLHIPAQSGSALSIFKDIHADIGDEQSIEQSLSTFSGHIQNIIQILAQASRHSLVLLDELGAGTDPQEGAALARAILTHLAQQRITCLVATHYPELKALAHATPGMINASMEFDLGTLLPTYRLIIGLPGRSNALLVAERLGLDKEIIAGARSTLSPSDLVAEDLLDEINRQRDLTRQARAEAEHARSEAEKLRNELAVRLEKIEAERTTILEKARRQADEEINSLHEELTSLRRQMRALNPGEAIRPLQQQVEAARESVQERLERQTPLSKPAERPLQVGDKVLLRSMKTPGKITAINDEEIEVLLGTLRVRARKEDLQRPGSSPEAPADLPPAKPSQTRKKQALFHPSPGVELDLRGERSDDALDRLERHIESAYLAGLPFVRVIHGKGTGALRLAVRQKLRHAAHVTSWTTGNEAEGGDGVTVVHLETN